MYHHFQTPSLCQMVIGLSTVHSTIVHYFSLVRLEERAFYSIPIHPSNLSSVVVRMMNRSSIPHSHHNRRRHKSNHIGGKVHYPMRGKTMYTHAAIDM